MHAISTKELRGKMPIVRSELAKGETFLIIHKSKPIAMLTPVQGIPQQEEKPDTDFEALQAAATEDMGDDFLTDEEINYYMSL